MSHADKVIFDFGMNICEDTAFYLAKGFKVVAIEANPVLCENAREQFRDALADGRLTIVNKAVARQPGTIRFFVCREMSAHSTTVPSLKAFWEATGETFSEIEVESISPGELFATYGTPYYMKVDIEGQDLTVLEGAARAGAAAPPFVSFEIDFGEVARAITILKSMKYKSFALVDQKGVAAQIEPEPAREGTRSNYPLKIGCSGLFGRELSVPWEPAHAVASRCRNIAAQHRASGLIRRFTNKLGGKSSAERLISSRMPGTQTWWDLHASQQDPETLNASSKKHSSVGKGGNASAALTGVELRP